MVQQHIRLCPNLSITSWRPANAAAKSPWPILAPSSGTLEPVPSSPHGSTWVSARSRLRDEFSCAGVKTRYPCYMLQHVTTSYNGMLDSQNSEIVKMLQNLLTPPPAPWASAWCLFSFYTRVWRYPTLLLARNKGNSYTAPKMSRNPTWWWSNEEHDAFT